MYPNRTNRTQYNDRYNNRNQFSESQRGKIDYRKGFQKDRKFTAVKKCDACRSVGEPFIGHSLYNCPNIRPNDRDGMVKSFALQIDDENLEEVEEDIKQEDVREVFVDRVPSLDDNMADVSRMDIVESPKFNVRINNASVTMILDTGATGSMISLDLCKLAKLDILPSSHSAVLADGDSRLTVDGEVNTSIIMESGLKLSLNALVVSKLKPGLIVGMAFMKEHDVVVDISNSVLDIHGNKIRFNCLPGNPKTALLRDDVNRVLLPGDDVTVPLPTNFLSDREVAVEPREGTEWIKPDVLKTTNGLLTIPNSTEEPVRLKRYQIIGQIRSVVLPSENPISVGNVDVPETVDVVDRAQHISVNPDDIITSQEAEDFEHVNLKYKSVFNFRYGTYNGKSGDVQASVILSKNVPSPRKGKIPSYNSEKAKILQDKFDELVTQGVLIRPEDVGVTVLHTSPSFLVKKADKSYRLVTSFVELNKYVCTLPTKMSTTEDVITSLGKLKYIKKYIKHLPYPILMTN